MKIKFNISAEVEVPEGLGCAGLGTKFPESVMDSVHDAIGAVAPCSSIVEGEFSFDQEGADRE